VFFSQQKRDMKVEVQIRTIAMDYWASLEHQMKYKRELPEQEEIVKQLKECAEDIAQVDMKMMNIRRRVELAEDKLSDEDAFMAKLKKLDTPIK
jgi:putative GTP pyrophosphokinase